ncbi:type II secretion system protein [Verrucomicrobiaceae bacterium N1E253]|uniref:Type II secretion system protein n=1 Tax=Oceaniferula marina TaxID=2748318 RepID=A0A851GQA0_9BACT|nr:type II secretion system protein [Oceaniferula marina]NWK57000.1 type II secretion system protein [Oceaniferula marina]
MNRNLSRSPFSRVRSCLRPSGVVPAFTLIEMLVVISIIAVLLTVGALGLKNLSRGSGVSAGLPVAEAVFAEARAIAIGKGTNSMVLVHAQNDKDDELHRDRYLRYLVIAFEQLDDSGEPNGTWEIASRGVSLPKGVYFMKDLSEQGGMNLSTTTLRLPGKSDSKCYVYQFNAEGMMSDPEPDENGTNVPRFVIGSASLPPGAEEPRLVGKNVGGFVVWRSGRTSLFRHPEQIDSSL